MEHTIQPKTLCSKKQKDWPFVKHSFKINFDLNDRIIFEYNNFFNNKIDYVLTIENKIKLGIGHLKLSDNSDFVAGAGRIIVNNYGCITYIDNKSGHYMPKIDSVFYTINSFKSMGLNMDYCLGVIFNNKMETIDYINKEAKIFKYNKKYINLSQQKDFLSIEIPYNFDWQVYRERNNLNYLKNEQQCIDHYKAIGYILGYKIAKNPKYDESK